MFVHGNNLDQKESASLKYKSTESISFLSEIRPRYDAWKKANLELVGPVVRHDSKDLDIIRQRVELFEEYKNFIDDQKYAEAFDSRSNLHSSVLEEFLFYLFKDLVADISSNALIGKSHAFKDIFFMPNSYNDMLQNPVAKFELKDHDFVIGVQVNTAFQTKGSKNIETTVIDIPAVAIECKTYIDKTMLEGSSTAAEQLKFKNPNAMYILVSEWIKLTQNINLRKYKVDQIYVLRKQKNVDREYRFLPGYTKNPVFVDVVEHLFSNVRSHLTADWSGGVKDVLVKGYID